MRQKDGIGEKNKKKGFLSSLVASNVSALDHCPRYSLLARDEILYAFHQPSVARGLRREKKFCIERLYNETAMKREMC